MMSLGAAFEEADMWSLLSDEVGFTACESTTGG